MSQPTTPLPVPFLDFPYVCRVCLGRENLESFEEENMMELFFHITDIVVESKTDLPGKICKECLNILIDISVFIDISKINDATLKQALMKSGCTELKANECNNAVPQYFPFACRTCLTETNLNLVGDNIYLCSLFQNITKVEMNPHISLLNNICSECLEKLKQISAFIDLSRKSDVSLRQALISKSIKLENNENDTRIRENETTWKEKSCSEDTYVQSKVHLEQIKQEFCADEKSFKFEDLTLPIEEIKLESHVEDSVSEVQMETGMFTCDACNKDFTEVSSTKDYAGRYSAPCNRCGKWFVEKQETHDDDANQALQKDLKVKKTHSRKNRIPPFKCEICFKTVVLYSSLKNHMKKHSGERPFQCETCHKTFYRKSDMDFHVKRHSKEKPFQCGLCGKCFSNKTYLRVHLGVHAVEKPFQCQICSKTLSSGSSLRYHLKTHADAKSYSCQICLKTFPVKGTLNMHMRLHSGENLAECEVCSKVFTQKSDLKNHMRVHTGEKPFKCEVCSTCFTLRANLNVHMRIHADEKPFKCEVCFKGFCQRSWVKSHMRIHTGERPFSCEVCGKNYAQKSYLRSHMRTHAPKFPTNEDSKQNVVVEVGVWDGRMMDVQKNLGNLLHNKNTLV